MFELTHLFFSLLDDGTTVAARSEHVSLLCVGLEIIKSSQMGDAQPGSRAGPTSLLSTF